MKLKSLVATLSLASIATAGAALAAGNQNVNTQINDLQMQLAKLQSKVNAMGRSAGASHSGTVQTGGFVQLNPKLISKMEDNFGGVASEMNILNAKNNMSSGTLYLGGMLHGGASWNRSSANVTQMNNRDDETLLTMDRVTLAMLANLNSWVAGYVQFDQNNLGTSSSGTKAAESRRVDEAYVLIGNLKNSPVYGFMGRKDVDFGNFESVNMYAQPLDRDLFAVNGNTVGVGYNAYNFNVVVSAMNGGANGVSDPRGTGIYNNSTLQSGLFTTANNQVNNFAVNASYGMNHGGMDWNVGAGYLNGSAASYLKTRGGKMRRVGMYDLNASLGNQMFKVLGEFVSSTQKVDNSNSGGKQGFMMGWNVAGQYMFKAGLPNETVASLSYSAIRVPGLSTVNQYVLGLRNEVFNNLWMGLEYSFIHNIPNGNGLTRVSGSGGLNYSSLRLDMTAYF